MKEAFEVGDLVEVVKGEEYVGLKDISFPAEVTSVREDYDGSGDVFIYLKSGDEEYGGFFSWRFKKYSCKATNKEQSIGL